MCLTGGFALAMLADAPVAAPVLAQPASPAPIGRARRADLGLSPCDLASVKEKVTAGCQVLGLRYENDPAVGTRFETLRHEPGLGPTRPPTGETGVTQLPLSGRLPGYAARTHALRGPRLS